MPPEKPTGGRWEEDFSPPSGRFVPAGVRLRYSGSRGVKLRREIAIVEALCRRAEAAGGSRPTTPKPIRAVLNERMKR